MQYLTSDITINVETIHSALYARFRKYNLHLEALTNQDSVTGQRCADTHLITYMRPTSDAQTVERMMGRDFANRGIELQHHPVIELRVSPRSLALELVMSPQAWIDQENLLGKLSIVRQRHEFRKLISHLNPETRLGFWRGQHLDDMHLTADQLSYANVFEHWMATYTDRQDYFRAGMWYTADQITDNIAVELFNRSQELYSLYNFITWTGNNDFRSFYQHGTIAMTA